jgi:hypothetical protein
MDKLQDNFSNLVGRSVDLIPNVLGAILVLLVGYLIAKGIQSLIRGGLRRAGLDRAVNAGWLHGLPDLRRVDRQLQAPQEALVTRTSRQKTRRSGGFFRS